MQKCPETSFSVPYQYRIFDKGGCLPAFFSVKTGKPAASLQGSVGYSDPSRAERNFSVIKLLLFLRVEYSKMERVRVN